jgi:hypothetical protein
VAISDRIPDLSDKELENLHANAIRLQASGTSAQREQAAALLPLIDAAREERRLARAAAQTGTRRVTAKRKPAAVKQTPE